MKISPRFERNLFTVTMAFVMSVVMSFIMTFVNVGIVPGFLSIWGKAFILSFLCAYPLSIIYPPIFNLMIKKLRE